MTKNRVKVDDVLTPIPEDLLLKWRTDAGLYKPTACRNCADDEFRLIDWRPVFKMGWLGRVMDERKVAYVWECKRCRMRQVVTAEFA
jgi:hypothetical protein